MSRERLPDEEPAIPLERALAARAQTGDERAFRQIYDRFAPGVYRFLRDQLGSDAAADEATQETFVRAHVRLGAIRDREKLAPFLFGIARNVVLEQIRAKRRVADDAGEALEGAPDRAPSPEALLLGREVDEQFAAALARLSDERRAALLLFLDHGLSYDEIAAVMDWSLAKVKVEIHRARRKLRAELSTYLGGNS